MVIRKKFSLLVKIFGLICFIALQGCNSGGGNDDDDDDNNSGVSPVFLTSRTCSTASESEPNNTVGSTQTLGSLAPEGCYVVGGSIADGSDNDGYSISLQGPQTLLLFLSHDSDVDFDLFLISVDLLNGEIVQECREQATPERCDIVFTGTEDTFEVFVSPFSGSGSYTLEILSQENGTIRTSQSGYITTN